MSERVEGGLVRDGGGSPITPATEPADYIPQVEGPTRGTGTEGAGRMGQWIRCDVWIKPDTSLVVQCEKTAVHSGEHRSKSVSWAQPDRDALAAVIERKYLETDDDNRYDIADAVLSSEWLRDHDEKVRQHAIFGSRTPEPTHDSCSGGKTTPGVLGGWLCPCDCHRQPSSGDLS